MAVGGRERVAGPGRSPDTVRLRRAGGGSYNELRMSPRCGRCTGRAGTRVVTLPAASQFAYVDYWGTQVVAFNSDRVHEVLTITGHSLVDTQPPELPEDCSWDEVGDASLTMADHLARHLYTDPRVELRGIAAGLRAKRPLETARRLVAAAHGGLRYARGLTSVQTSANEAYADGAGVCQDFAHLFLAFARSVGLPARYVSGRSPPRKGRHRRGRGDRTEPRVGGGLDGKVVGLRPDKRLSGGRTARCRRTGP